jgi:hypothetical protein
MDRKRECCVVISMLVTLVADVISSPGREEVVRAVSFLLMTGLPPRELSLAKTNCTNSIETNHHQWRFLCAELAA